MAAPFLGTGQPADGGEVAPVVGEGNRRYRREKTLSLARRELPC